MNGRGRQAKKGETMRRPDIKFEICIDSIAGVRAAERAGAARVELCAGLLEGGNTPSLGMIEAAVRDARVGVQVMIRPRGGDFVYSPAELDVMERDIAAARQAGAAGVVFGLLTPEGTVDVEATRRLVGLARPLAVTFHRAIDMCADAPAALDALIGLGIERVLTSGQEATALEGSALIAALHRRAAGRIIVMPGGGITERTVARVVTETGAPEIHFAALAELASPMRHRNPNAFMGGALRPPEFARLETSEALIRATIDAATATGGA
jgi:copper homeostasis protein